MARRLFIIEDSTLTGLGTGISGKMIAELKRLFAFVSNFTIQITAPGRLPNTIDFTDSIVKLVADDASVNQVRAQVTQQEIRSIESEINKKKLRVKLNQFQREAGEDLGGIGWFNKHVLKTTDGKKIALVETGGLVSVQTAAETALTFLAPNKRSMNEAEDEYKHKIKRAELEHPKYQAQKIKDAEDSLAKSKEHWAHEGQPPKAWPENLKDLMGVVLGRLVAHEARHQYVGPHSAEGLGMPQALPPLRPSSESFSKEDMRVILHELAKFEKDQKTARIHIETFPAGLDFAFKDL